MTDNGQREIERTYNSSIYSHKKDKDPYRTGLARFDSSVHDICVYIHRLQMFFGENQITSEPDKVTILFERIGEADKERLRYGFTSEDFQNWDVTTSKIIQKYPPRDPQRYSKDLKRNTQDVMNLPAHDYFGYFKNMYATYQMYTRATGTALDQRELNESEFVKQFLQNCRSREHLFLLQKVNDKLISDVNTLEVVIRENVSTFQTYYQVHTQEHRINVATVHNTPTYPQPYMQEGVERLRELHNLNTSGQHRMNALHGVEGHTFTHNTMPRGYIHPEAEKSMFIHNTTSQREERVVENIEKKEERNTKLRELEGKIEKIAQSVQSLTTGISRNEQALEIGMNKISEQFLMFTESFKQQDRDRNFDRNRDRTPENSKDFDTRGRSRERSFFGNRDRDRSPYDHRRSERSPQNYRGRDRSPFGRKDNELAWNRSTSPYQNRSRSRSPGNRTPTTRCSYCTGEPHWKLECPHATRTEKDRIIKAIRRKKMYEMIPQEDVEKWEKEARQQHSCPPFDDSKNQSEKHDLTAPIQGEGPLTCYYCRKKGNHMDLTCPNFCVLCEKEGHGWTQCQTHKDKRIKRFQAQQDAISYWKAKGQTE